MISALSTRIVRRGTSSFPVGLCVFDLGQYRPFAPNVCIGWMDGGLTDKVRRELWAVHLGLAQAILRGRAALREVGSSPI